jgi:hypothetical protein
MYDAFQHININYLDKTMKINDIVNESGLSRLRNKMESNVTGCITAYRSEFTKRENQQRNKSLVAKLMSAGYSVTAVKGSYIENYGSDDEKEVSEHSFFVAPRTPEQNHTLEHDLINMGELFDQDSVLIIKDGKGSLVGTSHRENAWPSFGTVEPVGGFKGGQAAEFMSRVNNRPYVFEELEYPGTINGIRGLKILASKDWKDIDI